MTSKGSSSRALAGTVLALCASVLVAALVACRIVEGKSRSPTPCRKATVQMRSFRIAWRATAETPGSFRSPIIDFAADRSRLYYACETALGAIEIASGARLWRQPIRPVPAGGDATIERDRQWRLARAADCLFISESGRYLPGPIGPYFVCAFDARSGARLWQRGLAQRPSGAATPAGRLLLVATLKGCIVALRQSDGGVAWQRQYARVGNRGTAPAIRVRAEGDLGAAQVGGGRLIGFRVRDGQLLWEYHQPSLTSVKAEEGESEGFALDRGTAYSLLNPGQLVAVNARTGRRIWQRGADGPRTPSWPVHLLDDRILTVIDHTLVAVDRASGRTVWFARPEERFHLFSPAPGQRDLLVRSRQARYLGQPPARSVAVPWADGLIAIDPRTGRESGGGQLPQGVNLQEVVEQGDRLFASDGEEIICLAAGQPDPLPDDPAARRQLAERDVELLFQWQAGTARVRPSPGSPPGPSRQDEARLRLIRLGGDSVPVLMGYVIHELQYAERHLPGPAHQASWQRTWVRDDGSALDLLVDIGDPAAALELAGWCDRLKNRESRDHLAGALVLFGEPRAAGALFRYSQSAESDPSLRAAALWFACRFGTGADPNQQEVTAYLRAQLQDQSGPLWLKRFALFELLDGRGAAARGAALAAFRQERRAGILPWGPIRLTGQHAHSHERFDSLAVGRDEGGTWWSAATSENLGGWNHLWFLQSRDGENWEKPAFALNLQPVVDRIERSTLRCRSGTLVLELAGVAWRPPRHPEQRVSQRLVIRIADLYRDQDGDGLPDRLERELGTDPRRADTNGNGIPDGEDKNPVYRPHPLTDEEGIYQATLEALCQAGRLPRPEPGDWIPLDIKPYFLGSSRRPLRFPAPPGSPGIEVLGHPGMVLCVPGRVPDRLAIGTPLEGGEFTPPQISLDGTRREHPSPHDRFEPPVRDPLSPPANAGPRPVRSFREFFPYEVSPDGTRARVGWEDSWMAVRPGGDAFDVEVRKIDGRWVPVECQPVYLNLGSYDFMPAPVRPPRLLPLPPAPPTQAWN
jgi:outer membrane protein assembly factor BamB